MKMFEFQLKCHWRLFPKLQFTIVQQWLRQWLGVVQATSLYLNQWWLIYRRIYASLSLYELTHWGRETHICVRKLTIIASYNGLSPDRRQAIIWTNAGILLIRSLGTNFSDFLSKIRAFSFKKMHLKMLSAKWRPFCLGLIVLMG